MTLKESLDELSQTIKMTEAHLEKICPLTFKFENFEWTKLKSGKWRLLYLGVPLIGSKIETKIEGVKKFDGLLIVAKAKSEGLIKTIEQLRAETETIGNH